MTLLRDFCGPLSEKNVSLNFALIYELLDEMLVGTCRGELGTRLGVLGMPFGGGEDTLAWRELPEGNRGHPGGHWGHLMGLGTHLGVVGTPLGLGTAQGVTGAPRNTHLGHPRKKGTGDTSGSTWDSFEG